jgi:hypothetical protein
MYGKIPWRRLIFTLLFTVGFDCIALNHVVTNKLGPNDVSSAILFLRSKNLMSSARQVCQNQLILLIQMTVQQISLRSSLNQ